MEIGGLNLYYRCKVLGWREVKSLWQGKGEWILRVLNFFVSGFLIERYLSGMFPHMTLYESLKRNVSA